MKRSYEVVICARILPGWNVAIGGQEYKWSAWWPGCTKSTQELARAPQPSSGPWASRRQTDCWPCAAGCWILRAFFSVSSVPRMTSCLQPSGCSFVKELSTKSNVHGQFLGVSEMDVGWSWWLSISAWLFLNRWHHRLPICQEGEPCKLILTVAV